VLKRVHARGGFVDAPDERKRTLQDRLQLLSILDPRRGVLVLDNEVSAGDIERQQLTRSELMIEPVDAPVLKIGERIVPRSAGQLVLGEDNLLLPRIQLIRRPL
jgi:hypothetical protein